MEILSENEAAEDEILLEELDWSKVGNDPKEIQVALAVQSQTLNTEIIDFLLQWEEDENVNKSLPDSKRVRDTFEVLDALSQVDNELEGVDGWISDQIDRLAQVHDFRRFSLKSLGSFTVRVWNFYFRFNRGCPLLNTRVEL